MGHIMKIQINGEPATLTPGLTVLELLDQRRFKTENVVVERNRTIVPRDSFSATVLEPGDTLEILHFLGGG